MEFTNMVLENPILLHLSFNWANKVMINHTCIINTKHNNHVFNDLLYSFNIFIQFLRLELT